jgi:Ca2+-binding EF-hand superfamily protein
MIHKEIKMGFFSDLFDATNPFEASATAKEARDRFRLLDQFYKGEIPRSELTKRTDMLGRSEEEK